MYGLLSSIRPGFLPNSSCSESGELVGDHTTCRQLVLAGDTLRHTQSLVLCPDLEIQSCSTASKFAPGQNVCSGSHCLLRPAMFARPPYTYIPIEVSPTANIIPIHRDSLDAILKMLSPGIMAFSIRQSRCGHWPRFSPGKNPGRWGHAGMNMEMNQREWPWQSVR